MRMEYDNGWLYIKGIIRAKYGEKAVPVCQRSKSPYTDRVHTNHSYSFFESVYFGKDIFLRRKISDIAEKSFSGVMGFIKCASMPASMLSSKFSRNAFTVMAMIGTVGF